MSINHQKVSRSRQQKGKITNFNDINNVFFKCIEEEEDSTNHR